MKLSAFGASGAIGFLTTVGLTVALCGSMAAAAQEGGPALRLRATVEPTTAVTGQQILYTLYLYTQSDVSTIQADRLPDFHGFWVHEVPQPAQLSPEVAELDGRRFGRVVILQRSLVALRPGVVELPAASTLLGRKVPVVRSNRSLFSRTEEVRVESNALRVEVLPLPPPPVGFTGAVGSLEIEQTLSAATTVVGEPVVWTLTLRGTTLTGLLAPPPSLEADIEGLTLHPPDDRARQWLEGTTVWAERVWRYVLSPRQAGSWRLPDVRIPYFEPASGRYRTAASEGPSLEAGKAEVAARDPGSAAPRGLLAAVGLLLAGCLAWIGARWLPELRSRRDVLSAIDELQMTQPSRRLAATVEEICGEFLAHRWPAFAGRASSEWAEVGRGLGLRPAAAEALELLHREIVYWRSAPELASPEILRRRLRDRVRRLLSSLPGGSSKRAGKRPGDRPAAFG